MCPAWTLLGRFERLFAGGENEVGTFVPDAYEIRPAGDKGFGVFATRALVPGNLIMVERPTVAFSTSEELDTIASTLNPAHVERLMSLACTDNPPTLGGIAATNGFCVALGSIGFSGLFHDLSRLNHSCVPNTEKYWDDDILSYRVVVCRPIAAGEEVTTRYLCIQDYPDREDRLDFLAQFGFECTCARCTSETDIPFPLPDGARRVRASGAVGEALWDSAMCLQLGLEQNMLLTSFNSVLGVDDLDDALRASFLRIKVLQENLLHCLRHRLRHPAMPIYPDPFSERNPLTNALTAALGLKDVDAVRAHPPLAPGSPAAQHALQYAVATYSWPLTAAVLSLVGVAMDDSDGDDRAAAAPVELPGEPAVRALLADAFSTACGAGFAEAVERICGRFGLAASVAVTVPESGVAPPPPLIQAVRSGSTRTMRALLRAGADVNARAHDGAGNTPLVAACCRYRLDPVVLLLEAGADPNKCNRSGGPGGRPAAPLALAMQHATPLFPAYAALVRAGADAVSVAGAVPDVPAMHIPIRRMGGSDAAWAVTICTQLLDAGAHVDALSRGEMSGWPASYWAAVSGSPWVLKWLQSRGADLAMRVQGTQLSGAVTHQLRVADGPAAAPGLVECFDVLTAAGCV